MPMECTQNTKTPSFCVEIAAPATLFWTQLAGQRPVFYAKNTSVQAQNQDF
jgi:hypothetical protein